jgi:hypothetical protein
LVDVPDDKPEGRPREALASLVKSELEKMVGRAEAGDQLIR